MQDPKFLQKIANIDTDWMVQNFVASYIYLLYDNSFKYFTSIDNAFLEDEHNTILICDSCIYKQHIKRIETVLQRKCVG
jgi:hypothetical protein